MSRLYLSHSAKSDLREIARFSRKTWGHAIGRDYIVSLRAFCQILANTPGMGRTSFSVSEGLFRMEHRSHVMFFRIQSDGIRISRILHENMLPESQSFDQPGDL